MAHKGKKTPDSINPNTVKVRDHLLTKLILGATKSGVQKDQKKEHSKKKCRKPINNEE